MEPRVDDEEPRPPRWFDRWLWWFWILLDRTMWAYALSPPSGYGDTSRWCAFWCRWRGHPAGVWFYNPGAYEADMHCKNCGDDLG